jgi:hypothetical protein
MSDHEEIRQLLARYCLMLDCDEHEAWVQLFTPDAVFEVYGRVFEGHIGLLRMATSAPSGLHLGGQAVIDVDGDLALTTQNLLFVDRSNGESRGAVYFDDLVRTPTGWRFARRRCRFVTPSGLQDRP